jgi:glycosyltransferase involved in cell wall biosynthesis
VGELNFMEQQRKIAFFTPFYNQNRGNASTAKRIVSGIRQAGIETKVIPYDESPINLQEVDMDDVHCLHILHFYRFAVWLKEQQQPLKKPYIITSGGTDINHDIFNKEHAEIMIDLLDNAAAITVFTKDGKNKITSVFPHLEDKIVIVPQSVWFPNEEPEKRWILPTGRPSILLPSGLRRVKDVLYLMEELIILQQEYSDLNFIIAGLRLDEDIFSSVQKLCDQFSWMSYIENVPFNSMKALYKWADYVLNTSVSEGQSSAVLEAMANECVVFARRNAGNASVISDETNGLLFDDGDDFIKKFRSIHEDDKKYEEIKDNAKEYISSYHSLELEISTYLKLYRKTAL